MRVRPFTALRSLVRLCEKSVSSRSIVIRSSGGRKINQTVFVSYQKKVYIVSKLFFLIKVQNKKTVLLKMENGKQKNCLQIVCQDLKNCKENLIESLNSY